MVQKFYKKKMNQDVMAVNKIIHFYSHGVVYTSMTSHCQILLVTFSL